MIPIYAPRPSSIPRREDGRNPRSIRHLREAATPAKAEWTSELPAHLRQLLSEVKAAEEHKGSRRSSEPSWSHDRRRHRNACGCSRLVARADREAAEKAKRADSWAKVLIEGGKVEQTQFFDIHQEQSLDHQSLRSMIRQTAKNVKKLGIDHDKSKRSLKDWRKCQGPRS